MQIDPINISNQNYHSTIKQYQQKILQKVECNGSWQQIIDDFVNQKIDQMIVKRVSQKIKQELQLSTFIYENEYVSEKKENIKIFNQNNQFQNYNNWISLFNKCSSIFETQIWNLNQQLRKQVDKRTILTTKEEQLNKNYQQLHKKHLQQIQNNKQQALTIQQLNTKIDKNISLQLRLEESKLVINKLKKQNQSLQYKNIFLNQSLGAVSNQNKQKTQSMSKLLNMAKIQIENTKKELHLSKASYNNLTKKHTDSITKQEKTAFLLCNLNTTIQDISFRLNQIKKCLSLQTLNPNSQTAIQDLILITQQNKNKNTLNLQSSQIQTNLKKMIMQIKNLKQTSIFVVNKITQNQEKCFALQKKHQQALQKKESIQLINQQLQLQVSHANQQIRIKNDTIKQYQNSIQSLKLQIQLLKQQMILFQNCRIKWMSNQKMSKNGQYQNQEKFNSKQNLQIQDFSPIRIIDSQTKKPECFSQIQNQQKPECFSQILIEQLIKNNNQLKIQQKLIIQQKLELEQKLITLNQKNLELQEKFDKLQKQRNTLKQYYEEYQGTMNKSSDLAQIQNSCMLKNNWNVDNKQNSFALSNKQKQNSSQKQILSFKQNILNLNQIINYMMNYLKGYTIQGIRNKSWVLNQIQKEPGKQQNKKLISKANMKIKFQNFQHIRKLCIKQQSCKKLISNFEKVANFYINHF